MAALCRTQLWGQGVGTMLQAAVSGHLGTYWCSLDGFPSDPSDFKVSPLPRLTLKQRSYSPRSGEGICCGATTLGELWSHVGKSLGSIPTKRSALDLQRPKEMEQLCAHAKEISALSQSTPPPTYHSPTLKHISGGCFHPSHPTTTVSHPWSDLSVYQI